MLNSRKSLVAQTPPNIRFLWAARQVSFESRLREAARPVQSAHESQVHESETRAEFFAAHVDLATRYCGGMHLAGVENILLAPPQKIADIVHCP